MRRVATVVLAFLILFSVQGFAKWQFVKNFPDDNLLVNTGGHGVVCDPEGKVWFQAYGNDGTIIKADGTTGNTRLIYCWYPDGTPAPWHKTNVVELPDGKLDTLWNSHRGLGLDPDGNILWTSFDAIYRFDYKTGKVLQKFLPLPNATLTAPATDAEGNIYCNFVLPGNPIMVYDKDLNFLGNVIEAEVGYGRNGWVTQDGLEFYSPRYDKLAVFKYSREDVFSSFVGPDTVLKGTCSQSNWAINPRSGKTWLDAGSYFDMPNRFPGVETHYTPNTYYEFDLATEAVSDSLTWHFFGQTDADKANERPRGLGFSVTGDTAYICSFGASTYPALQMHVRMPDTEMTADVTFQADVTDMLDKGFNPSTDKLYVLGGFNDWAYNEEWVTQPDLITPTLFTLTHPITAMPGTEFGWKFRGGPAENFADGGWEGGSDHKFTFTGMDLVLAAFKPAVVPAGKKLAQDVTVVFSVNVAGAVDWFNKKHFPSVDKVILNGDFAPIGTGGWAGWSVADIGSGLIEMFDNGLAANGDAVAGDGIWSTKVLFAAGTAAAHYYKYGIYSAGYTDTLNAGVIPMDNEAGFAMNHQVTINDVNPVFVNVTDKFGSQWVSVERIPTAGMPEAFVLHANYPNPFNPTTTITYDLASNSHVRLTIFNAMGQIVATLVDANQTPGTYRATWDGKNLSGAIVPSGVYFYRIEGDGFAKTMKMTLMK